MRNDQARLGTMTSEARSDSQSRELPSSCGFDSHLRHQAITHLESSAADASFTRNHLTCSTRLVGYAWRLQTMAHLDTWFPITWQVRNMKNVANSRFPIMTCDENPYSEGQDLPKLTRAAVTKTF